MTNQPPEPATYEQIVTGNTAIIAALIGFLRAKGIISPNELRQVSGFAKRWIEANVAGADAQLAQDACKFVDGFLAPLEVEPSLRPPQTLQ